MVAAMVGYFAIIWLTRIVRSGRIWWFSLYLVVLAIVVLDRPPMPLGCISPRWRRRLSLWLASRLLEGCSCCRA